MSFKLKLIEFPHMAHKPSAIEVEIKTLLGDKSVAEKLIQNIHKKDQKTSLRRRSKQLNHYFLNGNFASLLKKLSVIISAEELENIKHIIEHGKNHSVRTRLDNDKVILVFKATADETGTDHGTARIEYEIIFKDHTLEDIDKILNDSGFAYQAKWSRDRREYQYKNFTVCIDRNAGYGYLAEFERVVGTDEDVGKIKKEIRAEMADLGHEELPQDRLDRMFAHYNANWKNYYGTEDTFTIE